MRHRIPAPYVVLLLMAFLPSGALAAQKPYGFSSAGDGPITVKDHLPHPSDALNYSEQWSITVNFGPGHMLNVNLVQTNLTTGSDKGAFRVEYKTPDGQTLRDECECKAVVAKEEPFGLACGQGMMAGPLEALKLRFKGKKLTVMASLTALAPPFRPGDGRLVVEDGYYDFMLAIPRASAVVKVNDKTLNGFAHMDHSHMNTGWHKISRHWLRTSANTPEYSLIFGAHLTKQGQTAAWLSYTDKSGRHVTTADLSLTLGDWWQDPDKKGYRAPGSLTLAGAGLRLTMPAMAFTEKEDMLSSMGRLTAFVVRRFSDPMRYVMSGDAQLTLGQAPPLTLTDIRVTVKQLNP